MALPRLAFCVYGVLLVVLATFSGASCKIYNRCELARELTKVHKIPESEVATWVCLALYESEFNTSAINFGSGDHGLFQISQLFWCSPPGNGHACGLSCTQLRDDDIKDDVICAKRIYREHKRLSGDGFNAWVVYRQHCSDGRSAQYIEGCSDHIHTQESDIDNEVQQDSSKMTSYEANPSTKSPVNTVARRVVSYPHVNNIAKHDVSTKTAAGNNAYVYNVAKRVSEKPTPPPRRATTSRVSVIKQTQPSPKPASNTPHKGFRIINGIVTYY